MISLYALFPKKVSRGPASSVILAETAHIFIPISSNKGAECLSFVLNEKENIRTLIFFERRGCLFQHNTPLWRKFFRCKKLTNKGETSPLL